MRRKVILGLVGVIFVTSFVYAAQLEDPRVRRPVEKAPVRGPAEKAAERGREEVTIPDDPQIREFSVNPTSANIGTIITLRWRVEPGISNPISSINMASPGLGMNVNSGNSSGSYSFTLPTRVAPGRYQITLAATNEAGRLASRAIEISITRELDVTINWGASPREFSEGQVVQLTIGLRNNGEEAIRDFIVIVTRDGREISRTGPYSSMTGSGGTYDISSRGFRAYPGTYQVEVRSGERVSRSSEIRTQTLPLRYTLPGTR